ncbi:hypothetical protein [Streptomyces sp. NPDC001604]|uniref:hypothetical protein n=1 Tax=Streptomyces sp. NPDC001604 TaxID=3364593 RepID=UPI0036B238FB
MRFDNHPAHSSAAVAHLTGPQQQIAQALLTFHGFEPLDKHATTGHKGRGHHRHEILPGAKYRIASSAGR